MRPVLPLLTRALLLLTRATSLSFSVRRATGASISSRVNAFYREHGYAALAKPHESLLVIDERGSDAIAGAARLVTQHDGVLFLRGVFVAPAWRRRGVGTMLARAATEQSVQDGRPCFTCAFDDVSPLYARAGFAVLDEAPASVQSVFDTVSRQQRRKHKRVVLMGRGFAPSPLRPVQDADSGALEGRGAAPATADDAPRAAPLSVLLLRHANEPTRRTGTGPLLEHAAMLEHLSVERAEWSGRADNARLEERLERLPSPALLWTDGAAATSAPNYERGDPRTFIIIDGTWQEARKIFRKGPPMLRALPRIALRPKAASTYTLRGNFGWRRRFSALEHDDGERLLCTAEAAAELLDEIVGDSGGGEELRGVLAQFQQEVRSGVPGPASGGVNPAARPAA